MSEFQMSESEAHFMRPFNSCIKQVKDVQDWIAIMKIGTWFEFLQLCTSNHFL
jgi:hypothetical protein